MNAKPRSPKPVLDLTHVFTGFRLKTTVDTLERELTPIAAANALLAYREHVKALGLVVMTALFLALAACGGNVDPTPERRPTAVIVLVHGQDGDYIPDAGRETSVEVDATTDDAMPVGCSMVETNPTDAGGFCPGILWACTPGYDAGTFFAPFECTPRGDLKCCQIGGLP